MGPEEIGLKQFFYSSFDESAIATILSRLARIAEIDRRQEKNFIGEGTHFQSFELSTKPLALVANVAKNSFTRQGDAAVSRWQEALSLAQSLEAPTLVPPLAIVRSAGLLAIVMPKGLEVARGQAKLIDQQLIDTAKALGSLGLVLDDYPQIREAMGVPFIIDWSDLAFKSQRLRSCV